jgi:hypothetical protein
MERVLKDDAVQEKGERARMVRQHNPSPIRLVSFLLLWAVLSQLNSKGYLGKSTRSGTSAFPRCL